MPAKSKKQQRFMGMVHAHQKGELKDAPKSVKKAADSMTKKAAKDFAKTKHKGLPEKVTEQEKQKVYLSKTQSGRPGLFTKGFLAWPLEPEEATPEKARVIAQRAGFEFEDGYVGEGLKSMTFKEYIELDEGAWDFIKGAGREVQRKVGQKIAAYGQSGLGGTMADIWQAGSEASAAGKAERVLKTQLAQFLKVAQTPGGMAALKAALTQQGAPAVAQPKPAAQQPAQRAPVQKAPASAGPDAFRTTQKPKMKMGQHGPEHVFAGLETPVLGKFLTDGVLDFARGAGQAIKQKVAQSAPVRAGREIVQAGRQASAAADAKNLAVMAQNLLNTIRTTANGTTIVKQALEKMGALGRIIHQYLQRLAKPQTAPQKGAEIWNS